MGLETFVKETLPPIIAGKTQTGRTTSMVTSANPVQKLRVAAFHVIVGSEPKLLGNNEGANPVEFLLHALAGCVTTTLVLHTAARGIAIQKLSTELEGDLDVRGLLGLTRL
jgi:uncharacterized OsmC-like protein